MKFFVLALLLAGASASADVPDDATWNADLTNPYNYMVQGNLPGEDAGQAAEDEDQVKSLFKSAFRKATIAKQGLIEAGEKFQIVSKLDQAKQDKQKALDMSKDAAADYQKGMDLLTEAKKLDSSRDFLEDDHLGQKVSNMINADGDQNDMTKSSEYESKNLIAEDQDDLASTAKTRGRESKANALKDFLG